MSSAVRLLRSTFNNDINFFWLVLHASMGPSESLFYVSPTTSFVSLTFSNIGRTPKWETYVLLDATVILLATLANEVYTTARDCCECARNKPSKKWRRPQQLFPTSGPLQLVATDILVPLPKTLIGHQLVLRNKYRYEKLTRSLPTSKTTVSHIASLSLDIWVIPYEIAEYCLTDNWPQLISTFFELQCAF